MKLKHNKKRNTAFLYEALVKEITKAVMDKDVEKKNIFEAKIRFLTIFSGFMQLFSFHVKIWICAENMAKPSLGT